MSAWGHDIRDQWSFDSNVVFLNHGSFGAVPRRVRRYQRQLQDEMDENPVAFLCGCIQGRIRRAIVDVAVFVGAPADDLVFVQNATGGVNAVLRSLNLGPDDVLLTTTHVYGAVRQALQYVCDQSGASLLEVVIPFPIVDDQQVIDAVVAALDGQTIRVAVLDHITSMTGLVLPIEALVQACHARGVPVLVDGAHVPGHLPLSIAKIGAEWYTGNLHKWAFAPRGTAILYTRPDVQAATHGLVTSHGYGQGYTGEFDWPGTFDTTPWLSAGEALQFAQQLGVQKMQAYNHGLANEAGNLLAAHWKTTRPSPKGMTGNLVTVRPPVHVPPTFEAAQVLHDALLRRYNIEVPCFPFGDRVWVRISGQVYNELGDYEKLADALTADGVR
ncbi:MAG: aminotransferase class V-fold PLP-dependent enzyme [Rhodobacterales bacterium]|nr:aminotransferase class V-fold PLP-dependent enzyme [Rhodobacterales bacterium]